MPTIKVTFAIHNSFYIYYDATTYRLGRWLHLFGCVLNWRYDRETGSKYKNDNPGLKTTLPQAA